MTRGTKSSAFSNRVPTKRVPWLEKKSRNGFLGWRKNLGTGAAAGTRSPAADGLIVTNNQTETVDELMIENKIIRNRPTCFQPHATGPTTRRNRGTEAIASHSISSHSSKNWNFNLPHQ